MHSAICVAENVLKAMSTNTPIYTMEVKRALFCPLFGKILEKSVSFLKELYVMRENRAKCANNFGIWGGTYFFLLCGKHASMRWDKGRMRAGPPPSPPYWIALVEVSPPTIPVFRDKQTSPLQVTELEYIS